MDAPQLSQEWFAARRNRVTGSICGAILGMSPYMDRVGVMRSMVRAALGEPSEFTGNVATEWGNANESNARIDYEMDTMHEVQAAPFVPFEDWLGASPDGFVGNDGLVEFKCPYGIRNEAHPVPFKQLAQQEHYYAQVQIELFVTKRKWLHFYQWAPAGQKLETIFPDVDWLDHNLPILRQFHAEFLHERDSNAGDYLSEMRVTIDTPDAHKMIAEWDQLSDAIAQAEERKKDILADMLAMSGEHNAFVAGRKLTLVKKSGSISYAKAVKDLLPEADLSPYTGKPSSYWRLT